MSIHILLHRASALPPVSLVLLGIVAVGLSPDRSGGQDTSSWADSAYAALRGDLQQVITNQEAYFQAHARYESDLDLLSCETSPGVTIMVGVEGRAFSAVAIHQALGSDFGCSAYIGDIDPAAFPAVPSGPGIIACTEGAPAAPLSTVLDPMAEPVYIAHDVPPAMRNPRRFLAALERMYPDHLREDRIEGTAEISLFVCDRGTVLKTVLERTSGHDQLDEVAMRVAETATFEPALKDGDPVGVWVTIPVTFRVRD